MDELKEECGVFGIYRHPEAANMAYLGLYALQHRGQESAGITASDGIDLRTYKGMGLVGQVFDKNILRSLPGSLAIVTPRPIIRRWNDPEITARASRPTRRSVRCAWQSCFQLLPGIF